MEKEEGVIDWHNCRLENSRTVNWKRSFESRFIRKCDLLCLVVIFVTCLWFYLEDFEILVSRVLEKIAEILQSNASKRDVLSCSYFESVSSLSYGCTGFVQGLTFLEKSWSVQTSFPHLEKAWLKAWIFALGMVFKNGKSNFFCSSRILLDVVCKTKKKKQKKEIQWFRTFYVRIVQWLLYNCIASWGKLGSRLCRAFYWSLIW